MMRWQFVPYAAPLFIGGGIMGIVAILSWRRRTIRGAIPMLLLALASAFYAVGYAFELGSSTLKDVQFWLSVEYIGVSTGPMLVLVMALTFTGHRRALTPLTCAALLILPAITVLLAWTDAGHTWIWRGMALKPAGRYFVVSFTPGGWYWVNVAYTWLTILGGMGVLVWTYSRTVGLYRKQIAIIVGGCAIPPFVYVFYLTGLTPSHLDLTPYALCLTSLTVAWGMYEYHVLDIVPVAREAVLNSLEDAVLVIDSQGRVVDFNAVTGRLTRLTLAESIGRPADEVFAEWAGVFAPYRSVIFARQEIELEIDGEKHRFDMRISPLAGRANRPEGRLFVFHDITDRVRAEREREKLIEELEAFSHTVAHDLKNPLMIIGGYAEVLLDHYDVLPEDEKKELLTHILAGSENANRIIDALLLLAGVRLQEKVESGPVDMSGVVHKVQDRLLALIDQQHAEIVQPESWPLVVGYAPWIEEIWVNYVSNAISYGGRPPRVELGYDASESKMLRFWVRDNGSGLTAEQQARLFRPFTRLDQAKITGHGLGLSIVQRIAERLEGQVGVESTPGRGSLFFFTLPAAKNAQPASPYQK